MGRYRSRSGSWSRSPRRSQSYSPKRRSRDDVPRDRYRGGRRSPPSGLLVRNISLAARPEDLRIPFERFGPVKDVYLPKNYHTGEPRGFGFVKFRYPEDAAEAKQQMNHQVIGGREITIVFAEENRKTPQEMRTNVRISGRYMGGSYRRRSPPRSQRHHYHSYSRSPSPRHNSRLLNWKETLKNTWISKDKEKRDIPKSDWLLVTLKAIWEVFSSDHLHQLLNVQMTCMFQFLDLWLVRFPTNWNCQNHLFMVWKLFCMFSFTFVVWYLGFAYYPVNKESRAYRCQKRKDPYLQSMGAHQSPYS